MALSVKTSSQLVSALKSVSGGEEIALADGIYDMPTISVTPRSEVRIIGGKNAKVITKTAWNDGLQRCKNLTFDGIGVGNCVVQGGTDIKFLKTAHSGQLRFRGPCIRPVVNWAAFSGFSQRGISFDGRANGNYRIEDPLVANSTFSNLGDDPILIAGVRGGVISRNSFSNIKSYRPEATDEANKIRQHADGIQILDALPFNNRMLTIEANKFSGIEWQAIIIQREGHSYGWADTGLYVIVTNNIFDRIGSSYVGVPTEFKAGGAAVMLSACDQIDLFNNTATQTQAAGLFIHGVESDDPNYSGRMGLRAAGNSWSVYNPKRIPITVP